MSALNCIPGIEKSSLELLEAAGFLGVESLAKSGADQLVAELERANSILQLSERAPSRAAVEQWIITARTITGMPEKSASPAVMPVNYEQSPQMVSMLATAPFAIPLPARMLMANQLAVSDIPPAILLNRYSGDLDVKTGRRIPENRAAKTPVAVGNYIRIAETGNQRMDLDTSKLRSTDNLGEPMLKMASPIKASPANDRVALLRAPRSSTNKGRNPQSRWYIRGVLHSHPYAITTGALVTLLVLILTPIAVFSALLLLLSGEMPQRFAWVPGWLIAFPMILPIFGICYLIWGLSGSCRICGQNLFRHRSHLKNTKAHRVPGLGYIFPLCIHILLFRWFRCPHCGTPVRLKE